MHEHEADLRNRIVNLKIGITCILCTPWEEKELAEIMKLIDFIFPEECLQEFERRKNDWQRTDHVYFGE